MTIASILLDLWRGGGGGFEAPPPGPGAPKKPRRNKVNSNMGKESSLPRIGIRIGINYL